MWELEFIEDSYTDMFLETHLLSMWAEFRLPLQHGTASRCETESFLWS